MAGSPRWSLTPHDPAAPTLAADARLSYTDPADDHIWALAQGEGSSTALSLHTRYGGRVGMVSLAPLWWLGGRAIHAAADYHAAPVITAFAPAYLQAEAKLTPTILLLAQYWAFDSHSIGGQFMLANAGDTAVDITLHLVGFIAHERHETHPVPLPLPAGGHALMLGHIGDLFPAVLLENGQAGESGHSLTMTLVIPPNGKRELRWTQAALTDPTASLARARAILRDDWTVHHTRVMQAAEIIPAIETGDADTNAAFAWSYHQLVQSFVHPAGGLPHLHPVPVRQPNRGFHGSSGSLHPAEAYLIALAAAPVDAALAQGIIRNYLSVQREDGWIDLYPAGGRGRDLLCLPILARLAWGIFHYTEDDVFLRETYNGLRRFFDRWFAPDLDTDGDGLPEWQSEMQLPYPHIPAFARSVPWGAGTDIRTVESPDLIAYLHSEAISLHEISYYLRLPPDEPLKARMAALRDALEALYQPTLGRYAHRDRDTHAAHAGEIILADGTGDEEHLLAHTLRVPARLVVRVTGGLERAPAMTLHIEGVDAAGQPVVETADERRFVWSSGKGVYTTRAVFSVVNRLWLDGLVRVYRVSAAVPAIDRLDISAVVPLWSVGIPRERSEGIRALLQDERTFKRGSGIPVVPASDPDYDPASARGAGGVWPFYVTLIGEGLIESGHFDEAAALLHRFVTNQTRALKAQQHFSEFYHAEAPQGLGEQGHIGGIVPLHLFLRIAGVRIISPRVVWAGGAFHWPQPVTIRQRGVTVERSANGTKVLFPSGKSVTLEPDAPLQEIYDQVDDIAAPP